MRRWKTAIKTLVSGFSLPVASFSYPARKKSLILRLTKLRLSKHKLPIETGRYSRPFKKPAERTCPICKVEMEDEYHFLNICPAYQEKRSSLLDYLENEYRIKISRMSPNRIFMFLINPPSGNVRIQKLIAKHIFECFEKRKGEDDKVNTQGLLSPRVFT